MRRLLPILLGALAVAAVPAPSAHADDALAETSAGVTLAGHGGWAAWSRAQGTRRYRLVLRAPDGTTRDAPIPPQSQPFDVQLGPDARQRTVAVYARCTASLGCDLRRLDVANGRDEALREVSSPRFDEYTPAIWGSTLAFTRHIDDCDVVFVKTLGARTPSRRLSGRMCLQTPAGHLALRGTHIVTSSTDTTREESEGTILSEIRRYSTRGGPSKVLVRRSWSQEPNLFGQVAVDANHVTTVNYGIYPLPAFLRVKLTGGTAFTARANVGLTAAFAKSGPGTSLYVEQQDDEMESCINLPCRIIRSPRSPFGRAERQLPPKLTVEYVTDRPGNPRKNRPLPFRGRLTWPVVQDGRVIREEPVAGVTVRLHRRDNSESEDYEATKHTAVTGPDGRYEIVLPPPIPAEPWFTAVAETPAAPTWAGRGTVGSAN